MIADGFIDALLPLDGSGRPGAFYMPAERGTLVRVIARLGKEGHMTVEQAQEAAMRASLPLFIAMGIVFLILLLWVIWCVVMFFRAYRRSLAASGLVAHVRCESCGGTYELPAAEAARAGLIKSMSVTRSRQAGVARVEEPTYRSFAKRFMCPCCHQNAYGQVLNIMELQEATREGMARAGARWVAAMVIGGFIIMALGSIPLFLLGTNQAQRAQEQLRESFDERYLQE